MLTEFLRRNECEQLYLVGDIFDGWKLKSHFYWAPDHSRVIRAVISKARRGTKVYYLAGNHDDFMRQFVRRQINLGKIRIANEVVHTTADGRRLLVMHGDAFDFVMSDFRWLAYVGDFGYEALMRSNEWINGLRARMGKPEWTYSAYTKTRVKNTVQFLSGFDEKVWDRCRQAGYAGLVSGHTHHAEIRHLRGDIISYNSGDWVESCTALAEDFEGRISVLQANKSKRVPQKAQASVVAGPRPLLSVLPRVAERLRIQSGRLARAPVPAGLKRRQPPVAGVRDISN